MAAANKAVSSVQLSRESKPAMVEDGAFASEATRRTALTAMARIGFGARGLVYLLVGAFAVAAAFNLGKEPHGIVDAVQAVTNGGVRLIVAAVTGIGLACLAGCHRHRAMAVRQSARRRALAFRCNRKPRHGRGGC